MAVVAWGTLFYGNGFYLVALAERHDWSASLIASAITASFLACIPSSLIVGWIFDRNHDDTDTERVKDLARYPELVWLNKHWMVPPIALGAIVWLFLGWSGDLRETESEHRSA